MMTLRRLFLAVSVTLAASTAMADPLTYKGKLGNIDIVVEIASTSDDLIFGRYFYLKQGIDIPLQSKARKGSTIVMEEEEACGSDKCGDGQKPPVAAVWTLEAQKNGDLVGTWKGKRSFPLVLKEVGGRVDANAKTPLDLFAFGEGLYYDDTPITPQTAPYDYLRLDVPMEMSPAEGWSDAKFAYAVDPRTKFRRPRVVEIAGGSPDAANAVLKLMHWRDSVAAFSCASLQYVGLNQFGPDWSTGSGSLGGMDETYSEVHALTPRLMTWQESGSTYCGGAHPNNYSNRYTMDVAAGEILSLSDMFADAADNRPGESLAAFVRDNRRKPVKDFEIEHDEECGMDDLIGEYLSAGIRRDGDALHVVFGLENLPHVINACADDLLDLPAAEVRDLLTPRFAALLGL